MVQNNVKVMGTSDSAPTGDEAEIHITENDKGLTLYVPNHLKVGGIETGKGNMTIATTHGNIILPSGLNCSLNLWQRGGSSRPRRNVTIKS
jgi:hypothetical protein